MDSELDNQTYDELTDKVVQVFKANINNYQCHDRDYYEDILYDLVYERDSWLDGICHFISKKYNKNLDDWIVEVIDLVFYHENLLK